MPTFHPSIHRLTKPFFLVIGAHLPNAI
jgi:hypothetical protein